jgi:hypothetical protein
MVLLSCVIHGQVKHDEFSYANIFIYNYISYANIFIYMMFYVLP